MIETRQTATIAAPIEDVWHWVRAIPNWAASMPGYQACEIIDADQSRWTLKVGVGGMVRTVKVAVQVEEWAGPECARFSYRLEGDPVTGGGTYQAIALAPDQTEIALAVQIEGSGKMAPMWEAMGKPILPRFAKTFAVQLAQQIEEAVTDQERHPREGGGPYGPSASPVRQQLDHMDSRLRGNDGLRVNRS